MKRILLIALVSVSLSPVYPQAVLKEKIKFKLANEEGIRTLAFSVNSRRLVAGGDKGTLAVYDLSNQEMWNLPPHPSKVMALAFNYDNRYLASASEDGQVSLYDFQESKVIKLNGTPGIVKSLAFSPNSRILATGAEDGKISLWDVVTREKIAQLQGKQPQAQQYQGQTEKILALAFSPDSRMLASGSTEKRILLWNMENNFLLNSFNNHKDWVRALAFSGDGKTLASGSYDKTISLYDVTSGAIKSILNVNRDWVTDLHYSGDGQYILSGGGKGEVLILDNQGKMLQRINKFDVLVSAANFSFDGKWMAVSDLSPYVSLFDCKALHIQPWKPYDVTPPSIAILSPKLLSTRDAATGFRKSVVHQPTVRLMLEVTDLSGVKEVLVNGSAVFADKTVVDRYPLEINVPMNSEKTISIRVTDLAGNSVEEKLIVEHKRFSGSVDSDKYHAILIAIQDYNNPNIQDLDQPVRDMKRLKEVLTNKYAFREQNIMVLENPDRNTLYAKFDELQSKMDKLDNLLVFYAGHGYWDEQLEQGYWLPSDAEPNKRSSWLSNGTLRDYIAGIGSRHTLLITDACFSGGIFRTRAVFENASTAIETLYLRKSRKAMTSGTLEKVPDKSVFIEELLNRLDENAEPYVTAEELFSGLRRKVIENSPNNQVPQYGEIGQTGDEGGEFIFIKKN